MPALSADPRFAAYYSETYRPAGETRLERASATFGERDGAPFLHVHGTWIEPDGRRRAGHLLPAEVVVARPVRAEAWGTAGAAWRVEPDAETNFSLFTPAAASGRGDRLPAPQDPAERGDPRAIEAAAGRAHRLTAARVRGIGSIVRPAFADGRVIPTIASEVLIRDASCGRGRTGRWSRISTSRWWMWRGTSTRVSCGAGPTRLHHLRADPHAGCESVTLDGVDVHRSSRPLAARG